MSHEEMRTFSGRKKAHSFINGRPFFFVNTQQYGVSDASLLASFGFFFCPALILCSPDRPQVKGIAHIVHETNPNPYVKGLVDLFGNSPLEGIIIQRGTKNEEGLLHSLDVSGIELLGIVERIQQYGGHDIVVGVENITIIDNNGLESIPFAPFDRVLLP